MCYPANRVILLPIMYYWDIEELLIEDLPYNWCCLMLFTYLFLKIALRSQDPGSSFSLL